MQGRIIVESMRVKKGASKEKESKKEGEKTSGPSFSRGLRGVRFWKKKKKPL